MGCDRAPSQIRVVIAAFGGGDIRKPPAIRPRELSVFMTILLIKLLYLDTEGSSVCWESYVGGNQAGRSARNCRSICG